MKAFLATMLLAMGSITVADDSPALQEGVIQATVSVNAKGVPLLVEGPEGALAEDILKQLEPAFLGKARDVHTGAATDATYRLAIDWKLVALDGDAQQLQFDYRSSDVSPLVRVKPLHPPGFASIQGPVEVQLRFLVNPDGTASNVTWVEATPAYREFFENAKAAIKRWRFVPKYADGVAVAREVAMPMVFETQCCEKEAEAELHVQFRLDDAGRVIDMDLFGAIPDCHDPDAIREQIRTAIENTDEARGVASGSTTLRAGELRFEMPPCAGET